MCFDLQAILCLISLHRCISCINLWLNRCLDTKRKGLSLGVRNICLSLHLLRWSLNWALSTCFLSFNLACLCLSLTIRFLDKYMIKLSFCRANTQIWRLLVNMNKTNITDLMNCWSFIKFLMKIYCDFWLNFSHFFCYKEVFLHFVDLKLKYSFLWSWKTVETWIDC